MESRAENWQFLLLLGRAGNTDMLGFGVVVDGTHLWTARTGRPPDVAMEPGGLTVSRIRFNIDESDTPDTIATLVDAPTDIAKRAADFATPTPGAASFASVDDESPAIRTYEGQIEEIGEDGHFRIISMSPTLPEYHTVVGSPVVVAGVVVGLLSGSAGTDYVDAFAWSPPAPSENEPLARRDA